MMTVWQWFLHSEPAHFAAYIAFSAFISTMPAPMANSGIAYRWVFGMFNVIAANISRATSTKLEASPNFQAALNQQQVAQGQPQTQVAPTPTPADKVSA
jgi:hypothetical protein